MKLALIKSGVMGSGGYKIRNKEAMHFLTWAVVEWVDVFTRPLYKNIFVDSVKHCQVEKGLLVHGWCLMTNHFHMIASAKNQNTSGILRDLKTFTSKKIVSAIQNNREESRREWMLDIFHKAGQENSRNQEHQFWRQDNHPKEVYSMPFTLQKLNYIHNNPVAAGIVLEPEHYLYSSAKDYVFEKKCGLIDIEYIM